MSPKFETWESYLYPPPGDTVLRNKFDERDRTALRFIEYGAVADRQYEVMTGKVEIPRTYDSDHLRAIHRHLFQDVYDWAGDYRTINMSNPSSPGPFAHTSRIGNYLADAQRVIGGTDWHSLDRGGFAVAASSVFAYLNQAHPFREGNGRATKILMEHVAERSTFTLEFSRVSPAAWNQASMLSAPDLGTYEPVPDSLVPVFRAMAQPATAESAPNRAQWSLGAEAEQEQQAGVGTALSAAQTEAQRVSALNFPTSAREAMRGGRGARARVTRGNGAERGPDQGLER
jgi:cell filamentation protein